MCGRRVTAALVFALALGLGMGTALAQEPCDYEADFRRAMGKPYAQWRTECLAGCAAKRQRGQRYCTPVQRVFEPTCPPDPCSACDSTPLVPREGESETAYMKRCGKVLRGQ